MATDTERDINQLKNDLAALRNDLAALSKTLKDEATTRARRGYERAREAGEEAVEYARSGARAVEHQIEERPLLSVLSAFGVGLLVGKLMDR